MVNEIKAYLKAALLIYGGAILLVLYVAMFTEIKTVYGLLENRIAVEQIEERYPPVALVYQGQQFRILKGELNK